MDCGLDLLELANSLMGLLIGVQDFLGLTDTTCCSSSEILPAVSCCSAVLLSSCSEKAKVSSAQTVRGCHQHPWFGK